MVKLPAFDPAIDSALISPEANYVYRMVVVLAAAQLASVVAPSDAADAAVAVANAALVAALALHSSVAIEAQV